MEILKLKGELSELKILIRKKEEDKKGELLAKDKEIAILRGELTKLKNKNSNLESSNNTKEVQFKSYAKSVSSQTDPKTPPKKPVVAVVTKLKNKNSNLESSNNTNEVQFKSYAKSISSQTDPKTPSKKPVVAEKNEKHIKSVDEDQLNNGWKTVSPSKFKNPDVLIIGNSNIREIHPKFLNPLFAKKHVLREKNLRGATEYLKMTDVIPTKYIVIQAIDNDVSDVPTMEIISYINEIKDICKSRFPDVRLFVMEPLGRCSSSNPRLYWDKATHLCTLLSSLEGIDIIKLPSRLKKADVTLFHRERGGYIHLNRSGIDALSNVYRDVS
jgi:hypothetical protein